MKTVGANVHRFKVGDHVGVGTYVNSCRQCEYCEDGQEVCCTGGSTNTFNGIDFDGTITKGGYSNYIVVHERSVLTPTYSLLLIWYQFYTISKHQVQVGNCLKIADPYVI